MLSLLIKKAGINKVMMGTDYPRGEVENNPIRFIEKTSNLSRDRKDKIIGLNAAKLFNINIYLFWWANRAGARLPLNI